MSERSRRACRVPGERVLQIVSGDFPLESRLAEYVLGLLELNQLGRMLIEVIFSVLPPSSAMKLAALFKGEEDFQRLEENLIEAEDADDMGRTFATFLGAPSSRKAHRFTKAVRLLLKQQLKPVRASYRRRVEQLCRKMNLGADEIALLELGCCYNFNSGLERLLDSYNITKKIGLFSFLTGISRSRISRLVSSKGKLCLYRKYFSTVKGSLTPEYEADLFRIRNLCPGDIKAVWQRVRMMGRLESLPHMEVIAELEKEAGYKLGKNRVSMGF